MHFIDRTFLIWYSTEAVAAAIRLVGHVGQVGVDARQRRRQSAEANQLRMAAVAAGLAAQHRARQQPFAPQGDESFRVEQRGVETPEAHQLGSATLRWVRLAMAPS